MEKPSGEETDDDTIFGGGPLALSGDRRGGAVAGQIRRQGARAGCALGVCADAVCRHRKADRRPSSPTSLCWNGSASPQALRSISPSVIRCSSYRCTHFCLSAKSCHVCQFFVQKAHSTESRASFLKSRGADLKSRTLFFRKCLKTCGFFHTIPYGKKRQSLCKRFTRGKGGFLTEQKKFRRAVALPRAAAEKRRTICRSMYCAAVPPQT